MGNKKENIRLVLETIRASSGRVMWRAKAYNGKKLLSEANMTAEDASSLIMGAVKREDAPQIVKMEDIPSELVSAIKSTDGQIVGGIFYIAPAKHQFVLAQSGQRQRQAYFIPLPGLVYALVAKKGDVFFKKCFAVKEWNGKYTSLCHYPFGNVSNSGDICMGTANIRGVNTYPVLKEYIDASLDSVTNSDYLSGDNVRATTSVTQHELCDMLTDIEEFPTEILLTHSTYSTIEDLQNELYKVMGA